MAQTPPLRGPAPPVITQHTTHLRQSAIRIRAMAEQILIDQSNGRVVRALGRNLHAEVLALNEAMTALALAEEYAARGDRREAA